MQQEAESPAPGPLTAQLYFCHGRRGTHKWSLASDRTALGRYLPCIPRTSAFPKSSTVRKIDPNLGLSGASTHAHARLCCCLRIASSALPLSQAEAPALAAG